MKRVLLIAIGVVVMCLPGLQKAMAQEAYRQLTLNDFRGAPRANAEDVIAHTHCSITFHYEANPENGYYLLNFDIKAMFDKDRSWVDIQKVSSKDQLAEIIKHEQGHYAISYMEQQELYRVLSRTVFSANYRNEAQSIFDRVDAKYKNLNYSYDIDTRHMLNRPKQESWNAYFDKNISNMPPLADNN
jgi:hypothetical protein